MHDADWDRVKEIFHAAKQVEGEHRQRYVNELCGEDEAVREEVMALLEADRDADSFLDSRPLVADGGSGLPDPLGTSPIEGPGDRIGPYKLLQEIGEGGFGVVYMAEQESPIRRRVALKVIKPGMDTKQVIARFEAERQALAMMDHPNIARVFDAGTTPGGRPYFVMELVRGIPITDYCDDHELDTRERLEIFIDVCRAVEHAHQAGIIHRDLKPSNVLVTLHGGIPVPKVIDFGVAKATRARLTESTLFTEFHQFIGTPTYMSPEQAAYEGLEVDARSDVYSLGVLLYELLTGTTPLDAMALKRAAYFEVVRILKDEEPPRPSTRVTTMGEGSDVHAKRRGVDPTALAKLLQGDLDSIVMKSLEKDRRRRYGSASEIADDIGRYFGSEPIRARPPSRLYRARKLLQRRRGRFAAAAVLLLALLIDVGYVTWQRSQMVNLASPTPAPVGNRSDLLFSSNEHFCFFDARPSPDGTQILYANICDRPGLYIVDGGTGRTDLISEQRFYWGHAWSPDGTRVIAGREDGMDRRPEIFDLGSGDVVVPPALAGLSFEPSRWSPVGDRVSGSVRGSDGNVTTAVLSLAAGEVLPLAEGVRQGQASPAFSPDGRYVAFGDAVGEAEDLFVVDLESGERWRLTTTSEAETDVLWAPDGSEVAFRDPAGLWVLPVSQGRPSGPARLVRRGELWPNAWTENGFYYTVENALTKGYRIPVDPRDGRPNGSWEPLEIPTPDLRNILFAWSPDMSRAAVAGWSDGMIHIAEGGRLTSYPVGLEVLPSKLWWSADGTQILYTSAGRARRDRTRGAVMVLDPGDGTTYPLYEPTGGLGHVHVAPDLRSMVFFQAEGGVTRSRLVVSEVGSPEGHPVASAADLGRFAGNFGQPLFAPSGEHVLYLRNDGEGASIWIVSSNGTDERKLGEADAIVAPKWDPTGRMVAFVAWEQDASVPSLRIVDRTSGAVHDIEGFAELQSPWLLDWSPDGAWIAVRETIGRSELWRSPDGLEGA